MIRRPPRSTQSRSSAASDVYKRQALRESVERGDDGLAKRRLARLVRIDHEEDAPLRPGEIEIAERAESVDADALDLHRSSASGGRIGLPRSASRPSRSARSATRRAASSGAAARWARRSDVKRPS